MSRDVVVTAIETLTPDIVSVRFAAADARDLDPWTPGAHVVIELPSGLIRQYSLCGDTEDLSTYEIAVRREESGRGGSTEVHTLRHGDRFTLVRVRNLCPLVDSERYVFVAGGVGITVILPMLRAAKRLGREIHGLYTGRSDPEMAFRAEVASYPGMDIHTSSDRGRAELSQLYPDALDAEVYVCGPPSLIEDFRVVHARAGGDTNRLHFELFDPSGEIEVPSEQPTIPAGSVPEFEVQLGEDGPVVPVQPEQSIVRAILQNGYRVDFSCEEGDCGTCQTTVLAGEPDHRDEVLDEDEYADGEMLICVSRSHSARLVLDITPKPLPPQ